MRKKIKQKKDEVRLVLFGGCYTSPITVYPSNWETKDSTIYFPWYIHYRFYDPKFKDDPRFKNGKPCKVKGMNAFNEIEGRREMTKVLMKEEIDLLKQGYNPITNSFMVDEEKENVEYIISPDSPWLTAVEEAAKLLTYVESTRSDIKSMMLCLKKSSDQMRVTEKSVSDIRRMHIIKVLTNCKKSPGRQNKYRSYLHSIFEHLEKIETIEFNPIAKVPIMKVTKDEDSAREVLSPEQRIAVDQHLRSNFPTFWRFLHIFFHSGARETELLRLQVRDIDLANQRFKATILKGDSYKRVWKAIKTVALPFWEDLLNRAKPNDYAFSRGLSPGPDQIRTEQITRRWRVHVKQKLGVTADFYALKHLNTDETTALVGVQVAAGQNSHTTIKTTLKHYAIGESARKLEKQKKVNNTFIPANYGEAK